jgi:hypothetical protein
MSAPPRLRELLNAYLRKTLDTREDITGEDEGTAAPTELVAWADEAGRHFEPLLLYGTRLGDRVVTAIAALHYENAERLPLRQDVLDMLADVLADEERSGEFDRTALDALTSRSVGP